MLKVKIVLFSLMALAVPANASKLVPYDLDSIVGTANVAIIVKIVSANVMTSVREKDPDCQVSYRAEVKEVIRNRTGDQKKTLRFCSIQRLTMNDEYLVFFDGVVHDRFLFGLRLSSSFLDPAEKWLEIDSVTFVTTEKIAVDVEKIYKCENSEGEESCILTRARELIKLRDLKKDIEKSN